MKKLSVGVENERAEGASIRFGGHQVVVSAVSRPKRACEELIDESTGKITMMTVYVRKLELNGFLVRRAFQQNVLKTFKRFVL